MSKDTFENYFYVFYNYKVFVPTMAPFVTRQSGPAWFHEPFHPPTTEGEKVIHDILMEWFPSSPLWIKLTIGKVEVSFVAYQPNLVARQFGMS